MIVVADTGPINYLILLGRVDLLEALYGSVLIPHAVLDELLAKRAPAPVLQWARNPPRWLEIASPTQPLRAALRLDLGESEAIALALERRASLLLVDDGAARSEAIRQHLDTLGTLGVLRDAHKVGLVDLRVEIEKLSKIGFRMSRLLVEELLRTAQ